jgi:uncharacterized membrane protein
MNQSNPYTYFLRLFAVVTFVLGVFLSFFPGTALIGAALLTVAGVGVVGWLAVKSIARDRAAGV